MLGHSLLVHVIVDEGPKWDLPWRSSLSVGCFVRGDKNSMGCYVRGDKNCMGCFVRGGKFLWDVLSGAAKNGMGCFVPGCFVRLPAIIYIPDLVGQGIKIVDEQSIIYCTFLFSWVTGIVSPFSLRSWLSVLPKTSLYEIWNVCINTSSMSSPLYSSNSHRLLYNNCRKNKTIV